MSLVLMVSISSVADAAGEDDGAVEWVDYDDEACLALLYSPSSEQLWPPGRKLCHPHQPCREQHSEMVLLLLSGGGK